MQWFERVRLELHPENGPPYDVLPGRLGVERLKALGRNWAALPKGQPQADCLFFVETEHTLCEPFLSYWRANGLELDGILGKSEHESLALFGLPISEPQTETLSDGRQYTVQWFERARLELHPENAPPFDILLGLVGSELRPFRGPVRPLTGIIKASEFAGEGQLTIENGTPSDGLVVLAAEDNRPIVSAFVRSQELVQMNGIPDGTYYLFFSTGSDWDSKSLRFTKNVRYRRFEEPMPFTTTFSTYTIWRVTLHAVANGNAAPVEVDPSGFPAVR